jgi:hypothetical protein
MGGFNWYQFDLVGYDPVYPDYNQFTQIDNDAAQYPCILCKSQRVYRGFVKKDHLDRQISYRAFSFCLDCWDVAEL